MVVYGRTMLLSTGFLQFLEKKPVYTVYNGLFTGLPCKGPYRRFKGRTRKAGFNPLFTNVAWLWHVWCNHLAVTGYNGMVIAVYSKGRAKIVVW